MRTKIDYGIDLGTTNSAIARMENGHPVIKKSDVLKDTVPSCVHFNRRQDVLVGDAAFNVLKTDSARALKTFEKGNTNTHIEFKRTMGTTVAYESSNMSKKFSSEELSAEVLKKLKSFIQDENLSAIVITVPAKFLNPQKEATVQAARLAGFKHVELLQEPVAAATAYGLTAKNKDSFWLVFDFGGGTFDAALIKSEEGILSVKDTEGDNWLGGKNLDEAIVDRIIIPYLQKNYAIDRIISDTDKKEMLRNAVKFFAEEAKVQLSFKPSYNILSNLGDLPFEDENGDEPEIDITVTQADMETVLAPIFQKAIDIAKDLLKRNSLKGSDLGALILVGGPTYSPILRRMLKEQITENMDTSIDPMTVVAKGAALFASTISISKPVIEENRDVTKLQLELKYEATSVETTELVNIKVLKDNATPENIFAEIVRGDNRWSSSRKQISEKASLIEVLLEEGRPNAFTVNVYDGQGNKLECQPNQFNILQGIGGLEGMSVLPYFIGFGKWSDNKEKNLFTPFTGLEKNKPLPATGTSPGLETRKTIRPGIAEDFIRIPIYQGAYGAVDTNLVLHDLVDEIVITGEDIPSLLREGSPADIRLKTNRSEQWQIFVDFPTIDFTFEATLNTNSAKSPTKEHLSHEITKAKRTAMSVNAYESAERIEELKKQLENKGGNEAGKLEVLDNLRKELFKLSSAEDAAEWPNIEKELKDAFFSLEDLTEKIEANYDDDMKINLDKLNSYIQEFRKSIEQIINEKDAKNAKELSDEMRGIFISLKNELTGGEVDASRVRYHDREFNNLKWKDKNKAREFISQGLRLISEGRTRELKPILRQIWDLRIDAKDDGTTFRESRK